MKQRDFSKKKAFRFKRFARKSYSAFASLGKTVSIGVMAGCTLSLMSGSVRAQDGQTPVKIVEKELEEVMVTGSLTTRPIEEITKSMVVITKSEIERAPIQSISDLLIYISSIDIIQRGGHGVQADLSIRGGSLDQVAILINGINLSNAQTGHFALDLPINLSDIERIEVLHGPSALVYGSSAFSGGINIITKKSVERILFAKVEAGMHKFKAIVARGAAKLGSTINSFSAGYKSSEGYIANSDYDIYNFLWQTRLKLINENKLDFQLGYNEKKFGANTFYTPSYPNQYEETSAYLATIKGEFGTQFKFTPIVYWNRHHDNFELERGTSFGQNTHRGDTYGTNLILSYQSIVGTTSAMAELRKDEILSTKLGFPLHSPHREYAFYDGRTNTGIGIEHTYKLKEIILSGGLLINSNSLEYRKYHYLPSVSIGYSPTPSLKITTSWSKSNRMPTFTDLYYTTETHSANERLKAERSESWELGTRYSNQYFSAYFTGDLSWGRNIIDWVKGTPTDEKWSSWNHSKVDTKGVELGAKLYLNHITSFMGQEAYLKLDYSQRTQRINAQEMISLYSLNYLRNKFIAQLYHSIYKGLSASWHFRYQDRAGSFVKYENLKPTSKTKYPSFSTLDFRLNYKLEHINVYLNINNLYNTNYYDLGNIPQAGFWLMGGISYSL